MTCKRLRATSISCGARYIWHIGSVAGPLEREFVGVIGAAGDVPATVVPEHVLEVLVGLELEHQPELTPADAAIRIVDVLRPRGPAEQPPSACRG